MSKYISSFLSLALGVLFGIAMVNTSPAQAEDADVDLQICQMQVEGLQGRVVFLTNELDASRTKIDKKNAKIAELRERLRDQ